MSNIDPPDVWALQDIARYRLMPFRAWPATIVPLVTSGLGDYWIAHKYVGLSERQSMKVALAMAVGTLVLFRLYGTWTLPWELMWVEALFIASLKWLLMKYAYKRALGKREYGAFVLSSLMYCGWQWGYAATHAVRF